MTYLHTFLIFGAICAAMPASVHATNTLPPLVNPSTFAASPVNVAVDAIENQLHRFIDDQTSRVSGRIEAEVGKIDSRLVLAPCARTEPFLPAGARLWGKSAIGLRCVAGATWSVNIPVYIRVYGLALVTNRSIQAGQPLQRDDFSEQETELTKDNGRPVADISAIENKTLNRSLASGAILREEWLRANPVIQSGDHVRLVATGSGFSISTDGYALTSAIEGQQVKIRSESGRVVTGTARSGRIAEIRM
ncbi:MAG: flagellar basal body P-ring formation protein FlgA [Betaproteobacteria bacterium]|jgi:flagella basal body P-ring formation protein FlgA